MDSLSKKQKRRVKKQDKLYKEIGLLPEAYRSNTITVLPQCFYEMKNLKTLFITNIKFNITLYDSLDKYLPDLIVEPPKLVLLNERSVDKGTKKHLLKYRFLNWKTTRRSKKEEKRKKSKNINVIE